MQGHTTVDIIMAVLLLSPRSLEKSNLGGGHRSDRRATLCYLLCGLSD